MKPMPIEQAISLCQPLPWTPDKYDQLKDAKGESVRVNGFALTCGYTPPSDSSNYNSAIIKHYMSHFQELLAALKALHEKQYGTLGHDDFLKRFGFSPEYARENAEQVIQSASQVKMT